MIIFWMRTEFIPINAVITNSANPPGWRVSQLRITRGSTETFLLSVFLLKLLMVGSITESTVSRESSLNVTSSNE